MLRERHVFPAAGGLLLHRADEAHAFAQERPDQPLAFAAVTDDNRAALIRVRESRFRDSPTFPYRGDQIVLGDDALAMADQIGQAGRRPAARRKSGFRRAATRAGRYRARNLRTNSAT